MVLPTYASHLVCTEKFRKLRLTLAEAAALAGIICWNEGARGFVLVRSRLFQWNPSAS